MNIETGAQRFFFFVSLFIKIKNLEKELEKYKVITKIPIQWADMDAAQHVHNAMYLQLAEAGRILYADKMGIDLTFKKIGPILGWQDCKYIFPITYPDTAIVGARVIEVLEDRFLMEIAVFSEKHQRISALSKQQIIPYDYGKLKKVPLSQDWIDGIEKLENQ